MELVGYQAIQKSKGDGSAVPIALFAFYVPEPPSMTTLLCGAAAIAKILNRS